MLASITPLGERGRHSHWSITMLAFVSGSAVAGALFGAVLGGAGALVLSGTSKTARLLVLAAALLAAIALDLRSRGIPSPRRQVNERWLDQYRGWVYGLGYGAQLGVGVATVVTSAATYVALLAAFLTAGVAGGALIVGSYGAIRGLTPLLAARVRSPEQLLALHAGLRRARSSTARASVVLLGAALVLAIAGAAA
jgi:MFS family permease